MRSIGVVFGMLAACGGAGSVQDPTPDPTCEGLYGTPAETTGLDASACVAEANGWTPPAWTDDRLASLADWTLEDPPARLEEDPYTADPDAQPEDGVCAMIPGDGDAPTYTVQTFADAEAARQAGGVVTHGGACGACSSLADLGVYAGIPDLTGPVRQCALLGIGGSLEPVEGCLRDLGFTDVCAQVWAFNARHTQDQCFDTCIALLSEPYHTEDGALNACLQCDEDESGPVFKRYAGRTRRNSGLATALCRPCDTVWRIDHGYPAP